MTDINIKKKQKQSKCETKNFCLILKFGFFYPKAKNDRVVVH